MADLELRKVVKRFGSAQVIHGIDLAIRVRPAPLDDSDLVVRVLVEDRALLLASPDYLDRQGRPEDP